MFKMLLTAIATEAEEVSIEDYERLRNRTFVSIASNDEAEFEDGF